MRPLAWGKPTTVMLNTAQAELRDLFAAPAASAGSMKAWWRFAATGAGHTPKEVLALVASSRRTTVMASLGINCLALALPILILQVYDRVLPNTSGVTLSVLAFGFAVAFSTDLLLRALRSWTGTWTAARVEHALRCRIVDRVLGTSLEHFSGRSRAAYLEALGAVAVLRDFEAFGAVEIEVDLAFAAVFLLLIAFLGGWLIVVPLSLLVACGLVGGPIGRALHDRLSARAEADRERYDHLLTILSGIQTLKALSLGNLVLRRLELFQERSAEAVRALTLHTAGSQAITLLVAQVNTVALLGLGAVLVMRSDLSLGGLAACTLLSGRALQPVQTAMSAWTNYQGIRIARQQIRSVLSLPSERAGEGSRAPLSGSVAFENVVYRRAGDRRPLLDGVSLRVERGEVIALAGAADEARTALLQLAIGLLDPRSGSVRVDGRPVGEWDPASLRRQTAFLSTAGSVFGGTILENLSNFRDGETVNEALYLAYLLGLDEAVRRLPFGFDTPVDGGEGVSAELRRQIAFVRELADRPKLILFDHADAGLDAEGRTRLVALLTHLSQDATIILASADPQILGLAGRRYALVEGRVRPVRDGSGEASPPLAARRSA